MSSLAQAAFLAWKDYWHERLLSICSVLSLAATLTPLLVLLGVHYGIITALTNKLLQDPRTLEVTPVGSGKYSPAWFAELREHSGVAFAVPQTRSIAATMILRSGSGPEARQVNTSLIATAEGDPLLSRFGLRAPGFPDVPIAHGGPEADGGEAARVHRLHRIDADQALLWPRQSLDAALAAQHVERFHLDGQVGGDRFVVVPRDRRVPAPHGDGQPVPHPGGPARDSGA